MEALPQYAPQKRWVVTVGRSPLTLHVENQIVPQVSHIWLLGRAEAVQRDASSTYLELGIAWWGFHLISVFRARFRLDRRQILLQEYNTSQISRSNAWCFERRVHALDREFLSGLWGNWKQRNTEIRRPSDAEIFTEPFLAVLVL